MANQNLPVNDQTQAVLSKYGITAPKKITNIQNIQNRTETDINIVQPDIKVSAPDIKISPAEIAMKRYKSWIETAYARQKNIADKQKEELEEKDYSLRKNINKVFRKIEELRSTIVDKARNFKRRLDSSLTPLITLFVASLIPVIWGPLMKRIESIERGFRYLFFGEVSPGMKEGKESFTFAKTVRQFLGMDDSEGKSLFQGIGDVISEGVKKLIDYLDIQKDDRVAAAQEVLKRPAPGFSWKDITSVKEKLGENLEYLGDILYAAFGGSKLMMVRANRNKALEEIEKDNSIWSTDKSGKYIRKAIKDSSPEASLYLSDQAVKYIENKDTKEHQKLQLLFSEIEKLAKSDEGAIVSDDFLYKFLGKDETEKLVKEGKIKVETLEWKAGNDYLSNSSRNYIKKDGKTLKPVARIDNEVFQKITGIKDKDFYSTGREEFINFITKKHENIHGKEISSKAVDSFGNSKYLEINKETTERLDDWKNSDEYSHWNNAGKLDFDFELGNKSNEISSFESNEELTKKVVEQAEEDMGKITYNYGGSGYKNTDCSGYISNVYKKFGMNVPRGTLNIYNDAMKGQKATWVDKSDDSYSAVRQGNYVPKWDKLEPGDIMVWSRYGMGHAKDRADHEYAGHVSLYTGKFDKEGNPIILGHSGPGPKSGSKEKKGTKREGLNDLRSYLGTVRYDYSKISNGSISSGVEEKGDPGDDNTPEEKTNPSSTTLENNLTLPTNKIIDNIQKSKNFPETPTTYLAENKNSIIPDISKKPEDLDVQNLDIKNNTSETNKQDYYTTINDNLSKTLINMSASVAFKKTHAEQMIS